MSDDDTLTTIHRTFPCRRRQIDRLHALYNDEPYIPALYVYGDTGGGKTAIVTTILHALHINHTLVDLVGYHTPKQFYESILKRATNRRIRCDNTYTFIQTLKHEASIFDNHVIVVDSAERFKDMDPHLLPVFLRLRELSGIKLGVILISGLIFEKFGTVPHVEILLKVHFPQYTKDEFVTILIQDFDYCRSLLTLNDGADYLQFDLDFYKTYVNIFLSVFYSACRNLNELRHNMRSNFIKYCRPIIEGECKVENSSMLWRKISPILKDSFRRLYQRTSVNSLDFSRENLARSLELPYYAKFLLIAAYLASYNPAKDDRRLFVKASSKKKKTLKDVKRKSKISEELCTQKGPKMFVFDRLMAIFYAILEEPVSFSSNLLVQVSSLVELQLLTCVIENAGLEMRKYKCNVDYDFVQTICRMVGFNVRKYLSDFAHL